MIWPFRKKSTQSEIERKVTDRIVSSLLNNPVTSHDLNPLGVSEISVKMDFLKVTVTWYSNGIPRSIDIGNESFPGSSIGAKEITRAAIKRADGLLEERLNKLAY